MKSFKSMLWGFVLVIVGVILGLNALGVTDINLFFDGWWTLFIIVPCFIDLFSDNDKTGDFIGIIIGVLLLLACHDLLDFVLVWQLMLPIILIFIGISFIFKINLRPKVAKVENQKEVCATFSGEKVVYKEEEFKGCDATAVFGGIDLNLKDADIKEDVVINATSIFGGITIRLANNIPVKVNSTSVFGGVENHKKTASKKEHPVVYVNANCFFGGVDIK